MMKRIAFSAVLFLLMAGSTPIAYGNDADQSQYWFATLGSLLCVGGPGTFGSVDQNTPTLLLQTNSANDGLAVGSQRFDGFLRQTGEATTGGDGGIVVYQAMTADTSSPGTPFPIGQNLIATQAGGGRQSEVIRVSGTQDLDKDPGGNASGLGVNFYDLNLRQDIVNVSATMTYGIGIFGTPTASLSGGPNAEGDVTTDVNIVITQDGEAE